MFVLFTLISRRDILPAFRVDSSLTTRLGPYTGEAVRPIMTVRAFGVAVCLVVTVPFWQRLMPGESVASADYVPAQSCPTYVVSGGNQTTLTGPIMNTAGNCPVTDRSYVRVDQVIRVDGRGQVSGHCVQQYLSGYPLVCTVSTSTDRTVNNIAFKYIRPGNTGEFSLGQVFGKNPETGGTPYYTQTLDSTDPVGSTGPRFYPPASPLLFVAHQINAQMAVNTTVCNIQPATSAKYTWTFYAVDCLPHFNYDGANPLQILHMPENQNQTIKISVPSGPLHTAVDAAIAAWIAKLQPYGIAINFEVSPCAIADGGYCIRVAEENPSDIKCAESVNKGTDGAGVVITSPLIRIRDDSWPQDYLNWLMTHELGHLLGLDAPPCAVDKTVMYEGASACGQFPTGTPLKVPSASDAYASAMSAYRGGGTATCPVQ